MSRLHLRYETKLFICFAAVVIVAAGLYLISQSHFEKQVEANAREAAVKVEVARQVANKKINIAFHKATNVLYGTQITSCQSGNVVRSVLFDFAQAAMEARADEAAATTGLRHKQNLEASRAYGEQADRLAAVPFAKPNGERVCSKAITKP